VAFVFFSFVFFFCLASLNVQNAPCFFILVPVLFVAHHHMDECLNVFVCEPLLLVNVVDTV